MVGSSRIRSWGSQARTLARAILWRSPRLLEKGNHSGSRSKVSRTCSVRSFILSSDHPWTFMEKAISSLTVFSQICLSGFWKRNPQSLAKVLEGVLRVSFPLRYTCPPVGSKRPLISLLMVLFPAPLAPISATKSPLGIWKLRSFRIGLFSEYPKFTFSKRIIQGSS